jgi:microcystin degradation protein MlrC
MRIGIIGLLQESNTFISAATTIAHFRQEALLTGEPIRKLMQGAFHEIGGFFEGLSNAGFDAVPIFLARAMPYGPMKADVYSSLRDMMLVELRQCGKLDGILVACHGANVAETVPDVDGHWLATIREYVGADVPLVCTLDPHGNLSQQMVNAADAIVAYRTNPHIDQRVCGLKAASTLRQTLAGEIKPTMAAAFPPLVINIERQSTSAPPCSTHFERADEMLQRDKVISNSILLGFPYADVPEMGCSVVVVTDSDVSLAQQYADELARGIWHDREQFIGQLLEVEAAVAQAAELDRPVCLLDMGDNVGGGSPADGTILAKVLNERRVGPSLVCLFDPEVVRKASDAGLGASVHTSVGGKSDSLHGEPLEATFRVTSLHDGHFTEEEPRHGGWTTFDQGPTAVLRGDTGLTVLVNSKRTAPFSLKQVTSCGLDPKDFQIIVAKGVHAPVAAYKPVCKHLLRVNTPGVTMADVTQLDFHQRRRPLFPFERDFDWQP